MRDPHSGVCRVHRLAAGAGGAERVDAQVFGFDLDIDVLGFRENSDGDGRGVDPSLLLGRGHALYAMHTAFVFHLRVDALTFDDCDDFFQAADGGLGSR